MKHIVLSSLIALITLHAYAQCDCPTKKPLAEEVDYCFQISDQLPKYCAAFVDKQDYFYMIKKGKPTKVMVKMDQSVDDQVWHIISERKIKKAEEAFFVERALADWHVAKRKIGFDILPSGLGIKVLQEGTGEIPKNGQTVKVHYTGTLEDGTKFDSSVDRGQPFSFPLGMGRVIKGWDEGIAKLKVGTKAMLMIPSDLGYGKRGAGASIPPNATLFFEVELLGIE